MEFSQRLGAKERSSAKLAENWSYYPVNVEAAFDQNFGLMIAK